MGVCRAPVVGSGRAPAWTARVSKPRAGRSDESLMARSPGGGVPQWTRARDTRASAGARRAVSPSCAGFARTSPLTRRPAPMPQPLDARGARPPSRPRWRVLGHALAFAVAWPAFAYWFGPRVLTSSPMLRGVDGSAVRLGMLWSLLLMWREVLAAAAVLTAVSLLAALLGGGLRRTSDGRARQVAA